MCYYFACVKVIFNATKKQQGFLLMTWYWSQCYRRRDPNCIWATNVSIKEPKCRCLLVPIVFQSLWGPFKQSQEKHIWSWRRTRGKHIWVFVTSKSGRKTIQNSLTKIIRDFDQFKGGIFGGHKIHYFFKSLSMQTLPGHRSPSWSLGCLSPMSRQRTVHADLQHERVLFLDADDLQHV